MSRDPRRILYLEPVGEKGGAEVVVLDLVRNLDRSRFAPMVACLREGPLADELTALGVPVFVFGPHRVRQVHRVAATIARLARLLREQEIDLVHANSGHLLFYARAASRAASRAAGRAAVVWHPHDPLVHRGLFERFFVTTQRRMRPDWTLFANPAVAESYLAAYPRIGRHTTVVPGVDVTSIDGGDAGKARRALGIPEDAPVVSMFARLQRFKGHLHLIEAARRLHGAFPDARYVLCGGSLFGREPGHAERVGARVVELGLEDRVVLPGYVTEEQKLDILAASTVLAHPADHEPFGIAVLEAMAAGKPVVATDAAGPSLTVADGETGFLVPRGDVEALTAALEKLLADPDLARDMGRAGRARVEERYSVEAMVGAVEEVYDKVLAAR